MPSHIFHSIFAEKVVAHLDSALIQEIRQNADLDGALLLGAQGPDIFFHNRQRRPSGMHIGSILHRKGYGSFVTHCLEYCLQEEIELFSPEAIYLLAVITHAILDRTLHPFINYFAGWYDLDSAETEKYRHCHVFFERILDEAAAIHFCPELFSQSETSKNCNAQPLNAFCFARRFDQGSAIHSGTLKMVLQGLQKTFRRIALDEQLSNRIHNAYLDCCGFYYYCEREIQSKEHIPLHWAAMLHPRYLPSNLDFLNSEGKQWCDPSDQEYTYNDNLWTLYGTAFEEACDIAGLVYTVLRGGSPPSDYCGLAKHLGDHSLRSNIPSDSLQLQFSQPLPLREIIEQIAEQRQSQNWVSWQDCLQG